MLSSIENLTLNLNNNNSINSNSNSNKNNNNNNIENNTNTLLHSNGKAAKALLICHPNSHAFLDRTIILDKAVKIGRSVGHAKASSNNGIFDCKVLSRNHALIWYSEGRFYLKDTKSSNGTFVNRERLSRSVEESSPQEIFSGDTVQFGVDVLESSHNVTHGCIIASLKLFLPDGLEAKPKPLSVAVFSAVGEKNKVSLEDLYHLNEYIQAALQREQMLQSKLTSLKQLMQTLRESTELSWKALISNNSLLSRVELLEVQLQCYSKKFAEDKLREELLLLQEDKNNYQGAVKEFFQKIIDEKLEAVQRYQDLTRALVNSRTEGTNTKQLLSDCQNELRELAHNHTMQEKTVEDLESKLQSAEEKNKELQQKLQESCDNLATHVKTHTEAEEALQKTIKELENRGEYARTQVSSLQSQAEELQKYYSEILCELINVNNIKEKIDNAEIIKSWILVYSEVQKKMEKSVIRSRNKVNELKNERITKQQKVATLEYELEKCNSEIQDYQDEESDLSRKIRNLENELHVCKPVPDILGCSMDEISMSKKSEEIDLKLIDLQDKKKFLAVIQKNVKTAECKFYDIQKMLQATKDCVMELTVAFITEEDKLTMAEKQNLHLELLLRNLKEYYDNLNTYQPEIDIEEECNLKSQLSEAHKQAKEQQIVIVKLTKYFSEFSNAINQKVTTLEVSMQKFLDYNKEVYAFDDTLTALKNDSYTFISIIGDLQSALCDSFLSSKLCVNQNLQTPLGNDISASDGVLLVNNCTDISQPELVAEMALVQESDISEFKVQDLEQSAFTLEQLNDTCNSQVSFKSSDFIILKEKYRSVVIEKSKIQEQLQKLQNDYECLISYPNFNYVFFLPLVVLICAFLINYGKFLLPAIFESWESK